MELDELQKKYAQLESENTELKKQLEQKEVLLQRATAAMRSALTTLNLA